MAQAATLPHTAPHAPRRDRAAVRHVPVEERVSVLEAHWETLTPALATKADISDVRGEVRGAENRLIKWGVGAVIALAAVFFTILAASTARTDAALAASTARTDAALAASTARTDAALAEVKADVRETNARIDKLDAKIDARLDALLAEIRALRRSGE